MWKAPEIKDAQSVYGHPSDVYSFGLTIIYTVTENYPLGKDFSGKNTLN